MSQSLATVLTSRVAVTINEDNLEQGTVYVFGTGNVSAPLCWCWIAPASGTAIIEAWGAGGSGARMCCCGYGIPGNSGAYARRQITVGSGCFICGLIGLSCGDANTICFRGCSSPAQVCWTGNSGNNGCMCAEGGRGGYSYCSTSTAMWCCYYAGGFCGTCCGAGCGIICNAGGGFAGAQAYGGTVNCPGCWSCVVITRCDNGAIWSCGYLPSIPTPPGMAAACGAVTNFSPGIQDTISNPSGAGQAAYIMAATSTSKYGSQVASMLPTCWNGGVSCGCYEYNGCIATPPPGHPGTGAYPCGEVRDHGQRGGHALVKITFY